MQCSFLQHKYVWIQLKAKCLAVKTVVKILIPQKCRGWLKNNLKKVINWCMSKGLAISHYHITTDRGSEWDWLSCYNGTCAGEIYLAASEHLVLEFDVLEAGKMSKRKDLSDIDSGQTVMATRLGQSISKTSLCCLIPQKKSYWRTTGWKS